MLSGALGAGQWENKEDTWIWLQSCTSSSRVNMAAGCFSLLPFIVFPPFLCCSAQPTLLRLLCRSESPSSLAAVPSDEFGAGGETDGFAILCFLLLVCSLLICASSCSCSLRRFKEHTHTDASYAGSWAAELAPSGACMEPIFAGSKVLKNSLGQ